MRAGWNVMQIKFTHKMTKLWLLSAMVLGLSSCALVQKMTEDAKWQSITVVTPMADEAKCSITDVRGNKYKVNKTPATVTVRQGFSPLTLICKKTGYKTEIAYLEDDIVAQSTINLPDEVAGIVSNPYARVGTEFPREVAVWMEPERWRSEEHMRDWAFERSLYEHQLYLLEQKKLEAYRKREEERKFFKNWANNSRDKWERIENDKYSLRSESEYERKDKEKKFKDAVAEWGDEFQKTFNAIMQKIKPDSYPKNTPLVPKVESDEVVPKEPAIYNNFPEGRSYP